MGARRLVRTAWKARVTFEDVGTRRVVIYRYWARCAPGWCWRAARFEDVGKWSGKRRKKFFEIGIFVFWHAARQGAAGAQRAIYGARDREGFDGHWRWMAIMGARWWCRGVR